MRLAGEVFDEPQRRRVRDAVAAAERGTAAEIVPVVATASGAYERAAEALIAGIERCGTLRGSGVIWRTDG